MTKEEMINSERVLNDLGIWQKEVIARVMQNYADQEKKNWISVKDRLPDIDVNVLTFPYSMVTIRHIKEDNVWFFDAIPVTHWQPLPEPPKQKQK